MQERPEVRRGLRDHDMHEIRPKSPEALRFGNATVIGARYETRRVLTLSKTAVFREVNLKRFYIAEDVDRPCRLACQDQTVQHRFYIVNGEVGWFPFGTDCARGDPDRRAFCLSGKCLVSIQINHLFS